MPCYSAWNEALEPGTPAYERAEREVRSKLESVRHIVDYYYKVHALSLPALPASIYIDPTRQSRSNAEIAVREAICFHLACDGVGVSTLYDISSLLDAADSSDRAYLAVILPTATKLRQDPDRYLTRYD